MILLSEESLNIINIIDKNINTNFDKILEYLSLHYQNLKTPVNFNDLDHIDHIDNIDNFLENPILYIYTENTENIENIDKYISFINLLKTNHYKGLLLSNINLNINDFDKRIHIINFMDNFILDFNEKSIIKVKENINILDTIQNLNYFIKNKNKINLYFSYYTDKNKERQQEIDKCLEINLSNPLFNKIIIIDESENSNIIKTLIDKYEIKIPIFIINTKNRYKFCDYFNISNTYFTKESDINILINSDIILSRGFNEINLSENQMICLSRYNINKNNTISMDVGGGSHDCWIWKGKIKGGDDKSIGNFYTGKFLCDGVLANQLYNKGYLLKNPCKGLIIYHYHVSEIRHYLNFKEGDYVDGLRMGIKFSNNNNKFCNGDLYYDGCGFVCNL